MEMEFMAGAMSTLLSKLAMLLTDEYNLQKSLKGEIMFVKAELESMHAAIERVSEAPVTDSLVNIWASDVRELSYDIEDSIDKFMVRIDVHPSATPHGLRGFIDRSLRLLTTAKVRHQIATDIKDIKTLVKEVAEHHERYKVEGAFVQPVVTSIDPRLHGIYEQSTRLVAIDGPREELAEMLVQEGTSNRQLKVISIVGVGGLGKTTIANVMYQQLKRHFECDAFVPVSLKPDMKRIPSSILRQVSKKNYTNIETWDVLELINKIRQVIEDKRYFIIIDDIWDESAWDCIKCALVENNMGSRVITTTRIARVASSCCSFADGMVYKLKPLCHDDSKKLFYKRIFGSTDGCHPELREISEKILKKCYGVPLAIITVASILASKPRNINYWNSVHGSIGSGLEKCPSMENMRQILSTSYYDLTSHLKPCLLYLSIFPEDYNILKDQVVRRWVAEGFIRGNDVDNLYKQGQCYFIELINRSMIQPDYIDARGTVGACCVHDMVLDLITSLSTKENFVTVLHGNQPMHLPKKIRRLSLQSSNEEQPVWKPTLNCSHVRSLIVFPGATYLMPPLSSFQVLRVLDLEGCHDLENHHLSCVGNLFHLRYLGLRDTNITNIPNEIGNLYYLETLDLSQSSISHLPPTVAQLRHLVSLYIEPSVIVPDGIGNMESLQLLRRVGISSGSNAKELGHLTKLRVLHMSFSSTWHESYNSSFLDSLCMLKQIRELHIDSAGVSAEFVVDLEWAPIHLQNFSGKLPRLPRWMNSSLLDLSTLIITLGVVRQEDLQNLGTLPFLHFLCLTGHEIDSIKQRLVIGIDCMKFPCLSEFHFNNDKMGLIFAQGAMPKLRMLEVIFRVRERMDAYGDFNLGLVNLSSVNQIIARISCSGSRVHEVEDADSSMRKEIGMNSNHPKLDVIRYYEDEMLEDGEQLHFNEDTLKGEDNCEEEFVLQKCGPWGGCGGSTYDITVPPKRLESVKICSAVVVDAFGFSYQDKSGKKHRTTLWGGIGGNVRTIDLGPSEYLMEISGTYGPFGHIPNVITSLTLVTNLNCYGPFGQPKGTPFRARAEKNGSIVGFFGRTETYLVAIGVYVDTFISSSFWSCCA